LQESLAVAHRSGAIETKDLERVVVGTTVQEKAVAHRTDARLTHRALEKLVKREGVELRQSYLRVAKRAAIMVGRHIHARARRQLKFLRTQLGRIIRDVSRKIEGDSALEDRFGPLLDVALRVRHQEQRQRGPKVYSLHAPEVECIGKGKARTPYEFGCKVSIVTPVTAPKGGPGDLVRLQRGVPHGTFDKSDRSAKVLFWVSPTRYLLGHPQYEGSELGDVVALAVAVEHNIHFLPPPPRA
jgi:IS5 family transposase